ncbi:MAG: HlyC/CorC family transporter [Acidobacteria bacterium]|nr:HlyC/CorC family transporter [Acidobacteriota bacterium]
MYISLLLLLFVLIILSATFSGSEAAYFSITPWRLKRLSSEGKQYAIYANKLLKEPDRLLVVILLGNETVNSLISQLGAIINRNLNPEYKTALTLVFTIAVTSLLMIFGEISPKGIALRRPMAFIKSTRIIFSWWYRLSTPLAKPIEKIVKKILYRDSRQEPSRRSWNSIRSEINRFIKLGIKEGIVTPGERQLLMGITDLEVLTVKDVITPRHLIVSIKSDATIDEAIKTIRKTGHSRLIVCENNIDEIIGKVMLKDLLVFLKSGSNLKRPITGLLKPVMQVPEQIRLKELLNEMLMRGENLAAVFDEYGGTLGLVSREDIIEEIVGDIQDESDRESDFIKLMEDGSYLVDARVSIRDLEREIHFPTGTPFAALQGYLSHLFHKIPAKGETVEDEHFSYTIESIDPPRIRKVLIKPLTSEKPHTNEGGQDK